MSNTAEGTKYLDELFEKYKALKEQKQIGEMERRNEKEIREQLLKINKELRSLVVKQEEVISNLRARVAELEKCLGLGWQADRLSDGSWLFNAIIAPPAEGDNQTR